MAWARGGAPTGVWPPAASYGCGALRAAIRRKSTREPSGGASSIAAPRLGVLRLELTGGGVIVAPMSRASKPSTSRGGAGRRTRRATGGVLQVN